MMNVVDTLMILLFPFIDSIPFTLPRYWQFRDKLRLPFRYVVMLQLALASIYSVVFYVINLGGPAAAAQWTTIMRYAFLIIFLALAFSLIKDSFPKLMFTYLLVLAWSFFVMGNANYIESKFFWDFSEQHPYLVYNLARIVVYLLTCPFMLRFFKNTVANALKIGDNAMWRNLWLIPLFSTLIGMLYCTVNDIYAAATWQFLVSRYLMLFGACYVSYVALRVLETSRIRTQLEMSLKYSDRNLLAQKKQFDTLAAHMDETRKARHDLRQHLAVVRSYADCNDNVGLVEYLNLCQNQLPQDTWERYCCSDVVNAISCYYAALARDNHIEFDAGIDYPGDCPVTNVDITVLLGNLLENAIEACQRDAADHKQIKLRIKLRGTSALLVLLDNTCTAPVPFEDDTPLSSKRDGIGIGVASVREIAQRYDGTVQLEQRDGMFYTSVLLKLAPNKVGVAAGH